MLPQILEHFVFQTLTLVRGGKQLFFQFLELHGGEAFRIGQGLAADEMFRHWARMGSPRYFVIITEYTVIAHF